MVVWQKVSAVSVSGISSVALRAPYVIPETETATGKTIRRYNWYATPREILRQKPAVAGSLKDDLTIEQLERRAGENSDVGAAIKMQAAKGKLF